MALAVAMTVLSLSAFSQTRADEDYVSDFKNWVRTIGSDEFGGRKPMTPMEEKTVNYLAGEFSKLGLQPAFGGSWFQTVKEISSDLKPKDNKVSVKAKKVREFFAGKPLQMKLDPSKSMRALVRDLIALAEKRQAQNRGSTIVGTVLQHLVGAKLTLLLPEVPEMHGASVADAVSDRGGDFILDDVVIHVTSAPGEAVIRKCIRNIEDGKRPIVITTYKQVTVAEGLADSAGIADRIDVFDVEQFIAGNLYELGRFISRGRGETAAKLIEAYNDIVERFETDPSLKIVLGSN